MLPLENSPAIRVLVEGILVDPEVQTLDVKSESVTKFLRTLRRKSNLVYPELNTESLKNLSKQMKLFETG